jgi:hypothetical protein
MYSTLAAETELTSKSCLTFHPFQVVQIEIRDVNGIDACTGSCVNDSGSRVQQGLPGILVEVPGIAECSLSSLHCPGVRRPEFPAPLPNGLIGDDDSALSQQILDITQSSGS